MLLWAAGFLAVALAIAYVVKMLKNSSAAARAGFEAGDKGVKAVIERLEAKIKERSLSATSVEAVTEVAGLKDLVTVAVDERGKMASERSKVL
jgi:hypothetical protein